MRARCIASAPNPDQLAALGASYRPGRTQYPLVIGSEYLILGIWFRQSVVWYDIAPTRTLVVAVPALLFEIVQPRISRHWVAHVREDAVFAVCPPALTHEHFHHDLSEGVQEAIDQFRYLYGVLEAEDATDSAGGRG